MDLRIKKTERAIRRAFYELVQTKPIEKITVKELSERAEINKTTFYSHYESIYDLLKTLEQEVLDLVIEHLDSIQILFDNPRTFVYNLYQTFCEFHADRIRLNSSNQNFSTRLIQAIISKVCTEGIHPDDYSHIGTLLQFLISGLLGVQKSCQPNIPEKNLEYLAAFVEGGVRALPSHPIKND